MSGSNGLKRCNTEDLSGETVKRQNLNVTPGQQEVSEKFCKRCTSIPWKQLASETQRSTKGNSIIRIDETHNKLKASSCSICQTLALIKPSSLDEEHCVLRAYSARKVFGRVASRHESMNIETVDSSILGVVPVGKSHTTALDHGFLAVFDGESESFDFGAREIQAGEIDFSLVREWMSFCNSKHARSTCVPHSSGDVQDLQVIDCWTRSVVPAPPGCHYVALSYVWGAVQPSQEVDVKSSPFAPVVEDSISVAISMGYKYLWVDRYCVDQNDDKKHIQLRQMDKIYSSAQLTIIAAAGDGANYGLPGVSCRPRQSQAKLEVCGVNVLQIFPHPATVLKNSAWSKRGWTFQEGYLSNRRLVFTGTQLSYLCNGMHLAESVRAAEFSRNCIDNTSFLNIIPSREQIQIKNTGKGYHKLRGVSQFISEYSSRQLTYNSDAILALLGVLQDLERRLVYHIWGVPYVRSDRENLRLDWHLEAPGMRRIGFPTWSWAGWTGFARINDAFQDEPDFDLEIRPEVLSIVARDWSNYNYGRGSKPLPTLPEYRYMHPINAPRELSISGPLLRLSFRKVEWSSQRKDNPTVSRWKSPDDDHKDEFYKIRRQDGLHAVLPITSDIVALAYFFLDDSTESVSTEDTDETIHAIAFCNHGKTSGAFESWQYLIVLRPVDNDNVFRRIGIVRVRHHSIRSSHWSHPENPPMGYVDSSGNVLDEIDAEAVRAKPLWMERAVRGTIRLQ